MKKKIKTIFDLKKQAERLMKKECALCSFSYSFRKNHKEHNDTAIFLFNCIKALKVRKASGTRRLHSDIENLRTEVFHALCEDQLAIFKIREELKNCSKQSLIKEV